MKTILFIHGMFQNEKSWKQWTGYFMASGYKCLAPSWPDHEGVPAALRNNPPATLGELRLETVQRKFEALIAGLEEKPIVIGHSVGGLLVQLLTAKDLVSSGVAISTVAPNAMLSMNWNFFKNSATIANPLKGNDPILQTPESFHDAFANSLSEAASAEAFENTATHDSRNVLRDCMMDAGKIDFDLPHTPLLLIGGEKDHIIPEKLVEKNAKAYTDETSVTAFKEFPGRSHFICGEPGWEEVAAYVYTWLQQQETATASVNSHGQLQQNP